MAEQFRIDLWWRPTKKNDSYALSICSLHEEFVHRQGTQGGGRGGQNTRARTLAVHEAFMSLSGLWYKKEVGRTTKRMVFASILYGTALSGLEAAGGKLDEVKRIETGGLSGSKVNVWQ